MNKPEVEEGTEEFMEENFVTLLRCGIRSEDGKLIINKPLMGAVLEERVLPTYGSLFVRVTYYKHDEDGNVEVEDGFFIEETVCRFITGLEIGLDRLLAEKVLRHPEELVHEHLVEEQEKEEAS